MIQSKRYNRTPGTPPGMKAISIPSRNQNELIPKKSANPPHTPAKIRLLRERRSAFLWFVIMFNSFIFLIHLYARYNQK